MEESIDNARWGGLAKQGWVLVDRWRKPWRM
jgi:hypothetical protein